MPKTKKSELVRIKDLNPLKEDFQTLIEEKKELELEVTNLRTKLEETEETLNAIRSGEVDALIVGGPEGDKIFTLTGAEHPYRVMVETMGEGAVTLSRDGTILFSNKSFARLVRLPLEKIVGTNFTKYIGPENQSQFQSALKRGNKRSRLEASLSTRDGSLIPVYLSTSPLEEDAGSGFSVVVTDLTHQKNEEVMKKHQEFLRAEIAERKRIERELRTSEERFKNIVKDQSELICRFLPDGILTFVNPAFSQMAEMPENELLGNSFFIFLADEDISRVLNLMNEVSPADPDRSIEFRVSVKDKTYWMHWIGRGLFDSDGNLIEYQAVGRDMTAQKMVEESIRESEEKYRAIFEQSIDGILLTKPDGIIYAANPEACRILGMKEQDIVEGGRNAIVDTSDPDLKRALRIRKKTGSFRGELHYRKGDGSIIPCEISTRVYYDSMGEEKAIIIFRDISERKRTEAALKNSEERFRLASLAAQEAIWDWSPKENKFVVNENLINLFGRPPGDNSSREWWIERIHPEDRQRMISNQISLEKSKVNKAEAEYRFRKVDGTYAHVYDRIYFSRAPDNSIQRVIGAMLDTTKLKEAESILKERTRELENLNEELEGFTRSVSHDLRAPLSAIGGFARMLKQDYGYNLDQGAHGIFDLIFGNVATMENLIGGYLNLSRASRKEMICEKIDMNDLLRSVAEEFRAAQEVGRTNLLTNGLPQAEGDPTLIRQVFSNLLSNALKFVKKRKDPRIEIGGYDDADFKVYYVKDNGVGFSMKDYDQLFRIFRRLHSSSQYEGTGIGLSIVQKIIQRHGGRVWAEGKVNRGATFYFSLPRNVRGICDKAN